MANEEHLKILKKGFEAWNKWRAYYPSIVPDLVEADIFGAHLMWANLQSANTSYANLGSTDLSYASLFRADSVGAILTVRISAGHF
jgi:hypothetical protein